MERTWDWKHQWLVNECRSLFKEFQFELWVFNVRCQSDVRYKPGEEIVFSYGDKDKGSQGSLRSHSSKLFFSFRSNRQDSDALLLQHGFVEEEPPFGRKFTMTSPRHHKISQKMVRKIIP